MEALRERSRVEHVARFVGGLAFILILLQRLLMPASAAPIPAEKAAPAPAFTHPQAADWLNSPPLKWQDLRGHVVLVDFWTFDCWNCYRSIPWLLALEQRYPELRVVSVHTPELPQEYVRENVVAKVAEFKLKNPVMIDNDYSYWKAFGNRYWPAWYLIDKQGRVRSFHAGETHAGDANARAMEAVITALSAEP